MRLTGSSTLIMPFSAVKADEPFQEDDNSNDPTTLMPNSNRSIPFGSTLSTKPVQVRFEGGVIRITSGDSNKEINISKFPNWEREELMKHVQFAVETNQF